MNFDMGKWAVFIWGAYGISAIALIGLALSSFARHQGVRLRVQTLETALEAARQAQTKSEADETESPAA